jgi:hypothetical protein
MGKLINGYEAILLPVTSIVDWIVDAGGRVCGVRDGRRTPDDDTVRG